MDGDTNQVLLLEEVKAKENLMHAVMVPNSFLRDKARFKWLKNGDKNCKVLHVYAKVQ